MGLGGRVGGADCSSALIAVGALVGGPIDRAITKKVTVFDAGVSSGSKGLVSVRPFMQHARKGVLVAVTF